MTIIISDLHLGAPVTNTEAIMKVLALPCDTLIINGDFFDSHNLKRFNKEHWKVLSEIRSLSNKKRVIFIVGNHDGHISTISNILGVEFLDDYVVRSGGRNIYVTHGHKFDHYMSKVLLTEFFTGLYYVVQRLDFKERYISSWLKLKSKTLLKVTEKLKIKAVAYALKHGYDAICLGHSHIAENLEIDGVQYVNSGSFCERPAHYIEINNGQILLQECS